MSRITSISGRGIYSDLMRCFVSHGHHVYIVSPRERSLKLQTGITEDNLITILGVKTLNLQKTSALEKGIGQVLIEGQYRRSICRYFGKEKFDLILYSTPPITFSHVIKYLQKHNPSAQTYLLLKDIFPQNAVDIGLIKKTGIKGIVYNFFRNKEKQLYRLSDHIGCMSPANVEYILKNNPELSDEKVEIAPNSIQLVKRPITDKDVIRKKYNLPVDRPILIYGGNLGKPQGVPFLIDCLKANAERRDCHFLVIGNGTEYYKLKQWYCETKPQAVTLMNRLPKDEYDGLVASCDIGLIFLDHRFSIPNYPSRLLSYLENKMPIIAATDQNSDTGRIAEANGYGYWCESNSVDAFTSIVNKMLNSDIHNMGSRGYEYLCSNYLVQNTYNEIIKHFA